MPGRAVGNWGWRYHADVLGEGLAEGLRNLTAITGRLLEAKPATAEQTPEDQEPGARNQKSGSDGKKS
jgi:hypothetical protein